MSLNYRGVIASPNEMSSSLETKFRTIAKAITWQVLGLATTGALAWLHTGSVQDAITFALSTAAIGMTFFVVHERMWDRVTWGRSRS